MPKKVQDVVCHKMNVTVEGLMILGDEVDIHHAFPSHIFEFLSCIANQNKIQYSMQDQLDIDKGT